MKKIGSYVAIFALQALFLAGCVTQTYENGRPVSDEEKNVDRSTESAKEINKVLNSYKGEYADLEFEKSQKIIELINEGDVDTIKDVMNDPDSYTPPVLMSYAVQVYKSGNFDTAMFWYYTAQLRARSDANKSLDKSVHQGVTELSKMFGEDIGNYAKNHPDELEEAMTKVLDWDATTTRKYNPKWVAILGSEAKFGTKIRFIPESDYPKADQETRRGWKQGFEMAIKKIRDFKKELEENR